MFPIWCKKNVRLLRSAVALFVLLSSLVLGSPMPSSAATGNHLRPDGLKCEWRTNPPAINSTQPRLSWLLESNERGQLQTAYQILVASNPSLLQANKPNLWNSGKVNSNRTLDVEYKGKPLASRSLCYWKVRVWDRNGDPSAWTPPAHWTEGLLEPSDWKAQWIGTGKESQDHASAVVLRHEFRLKSKIQRAMVYVCGLGQFELYLNGKKVGQDVLTPGWTNYRKTDLYIAYDITKMLSEGPNAVAVMIGNGMYNVQKTGRYTKFVGSFGLPKVILQMEITYANGSRQQVVSDGSWHVLPSPITFNSIYGGEDYDARLQTAGWDQPGLNTSGLRNAVVMMPPGGRLTAQEIPPIRIMKVYKPIRITQPKPGVYVYDLGQNMSGWPQIAVRGPRGTSVKIIPGELLTPQGFVTQKSSGRPEWFQYTLKGTGVETWHPRFSYYGFRYVQIEGGTRNPKEETTKPLLIRVAGDFVHSSATPAGSFFSSEELFNRIHHFIRAAIESNMQSVLTDCPHREKLGWLEQTYLMGPAVMFDFNVPTLYVKIARDMTESQLPNGLVPDIAPEFTVFKDGFRDAPAWGSASILAAWEAYRQYAELPLLQENYPTFERYAAYLGSQAQGHIVNQGLGDWHDLGPKPAGFAQLTPIALTSTATYYRDLVTLSHISTVLGKPKKAEEYAALAAQVRDAFNRKFFNPDTGTYSTGSQTADAMPLELGLAPDSDRAGLLEHLIQDIRSHGNTMTTGEVGFPSMLHVLRDEDRPDVILAMNSRTTAPGYGYILKQGATTLTESWTADRAGSQNHFMIGQIEDWFYSGLAGIRQTPGSVGYRNIVIKPQPTGNIKWCKASYKSVRGEIRSEWSISKGKIHLNVTLPPNTEDTVYVPARNAGSVTESGQAAAKAHGVHFLRMENGYAVFAMGSGTYHFTAPVN